MTGIRFVYFDLDDTLLDHSHAELQALRQLHAQRSDIFAGIPFSELHASYLEINAVVWHNYSAGIYDKVQTKVGRFEQLLASLSIESEENSLWMANAYLDRYADHWVAVDGALEAFHATAERLPVGILTNGFSEIQRAKLARFPEIEARSALTIISEEVGHLKPDLRLFNFATAAADVDPASILYVGDSLRSDVEGGLRAGWKIAWFRGSDHDHEDVWSFGNWSDFIPCLNGQDPAEI